MNKMPVFISSSSLSPVDVVMMLSSYSIPHRLVSDSNDLENHDRCVFIFTYSATLDSCRKPLTNRSGCVLLLDTEIEVARWGNQCLGLDSATTSESLANHTSRLYREKLVIGKRIPKQNSIRLVLDSSDTGVMKSIMSFVYLIKGSDDRNNVKDIIVSWLFEKSTSYDKLQSNILSRIKVSSSEEAQAKIRDFETTLTSERVSRLRSVLHTLKGVKNLDDQVYIEGLCLQESVESFEVNYLLKMFRR